MILTQLQAPKQQHTICVLPRSRIPRLWKQRLVVVERERVKSASSMVMKDMLATKMHPDDQNSAVRQSNSWSRLKISGVMLKRLMIEHDVTLDLGDILSCFYDRIEMSEEAWWSPLLYKACENIIGMYCTDPELCYDKQRPC
jgi:hypothetical protein